MAKRKGGRPSGLTPTVAGNIISIVRGGNYVITACQYAGISPDTYYQWIRRGELEMDRVKSDGNDADGIFLEATTYEKDEDGRKSIVERTLEEMFGACPEEFKEVEWRYVVFLQAATKARAMAEVRNLTVIQQASSENWQAAAWWLERTMPDKFGRRDRMSLEGAKEGSPVSVEIVSVEKLESSLQKLLPDAEDSD